MVKRKKLWEGEEARGEGGGKSGDEGGGRKCACSIMVNKPALKT